MLKHVISTLRQTNIIWTNANIIWTNATASLLLSILFTHCGFVYLLLVCADADKGVHGGRPGNGGH